MNTYVLYNCMNSSMNPSDESEKLGFIIKAYFVITLHV